MFVFSIWLFSFYIWKSNKCSEGFINEFKLNQSLTNIPIFRCGRIRVSYDSPQYLKANVVFDKEMPSYDYSVAIGIDSNVLDCTAIYYENRSVHGFGISIYKADAKFTSVDGVNLSWIAAM